MRGADRRQRASPGHALSQILPVQVFHDDVGGSARELAYVHDPCHMRTAHAHGGARLSPEAPREIEHRELLVQDLDGDELVELPVPREKHSSHAALSEEPAKLVFCMELSLEE